MVRPIVRILSTGIVAVCPQDGGYWVWGLGYQYSFVTLIFGWLFSIVAGMWDDAAQRMPRLDVNLPWWRIGSLCL
jgi:hypothetical protein